MCAFFRFTSFKMQPFLKLSSSPKQYINKSVRLAVFSCCISSVEGLHAMMVQCLNQDQTLTCRFIKYSDVKLLQCNTELDKRSLHEDYNVQLLSNIQAGGVNFRGCNLW